MGEGGHGSVDRGHDHWTHNTHLYHVKRWCIACTLCRNDDVQKCSRPARFNFVEISRFWTRIVEKGRSLFIVFKRLIRCDVHRKTVKNEILI